MKLAIVSVVVSSTESTRLRRQINSVDNDRRYFQLMDMMKFYNPEFDEKQYFAYGCNCLILGELKA